MSLFLFSSIAFPSRLMRTESTRLRLSLNAHFDLVSWKQYFTLMFSSRLMRTGKRDRGLHCAPLSNVLLIFPMFLIFFTCIFFQVDEACIVHLYLMCFLCFPIVFSHVSYLFHMYFLPGWWGQEARDRGLHCAARSDVLLMFPYCFSTRSLSFSHIFSPGWRGQETWDRGLHCANYEEQEAVATQSAGHWGEPCLNKI